ncbi:MAG: hypothetical protein RIB45_10335 [Marivibrio sp.]|uniref:hypothetical protein n=1 Tax=Marivibrio sp. TaxID=2039719 RepID=UPI0032EC2DEE
MSNKSVLVESVAAVDYATDRLGEPDVWLTTSPMVYEKLRGGSRSVRFLDLDITQETANAIGYLGADLADSLAHAVDGVDGTPWSGSYRPGRALAASLQRVVTRFLLKGYLLDQLLQDRKARLVVVGRPDLEPVKDFSLLPGRFETTYATIAAEIDVPVLAFETPVPDLLTQRGDIYLPSAVDRVITAINADVSSIVSKLWFRGLRGRPLRLPFLRSAGHIYIENLNELVEETIVKLVAAGLTVEKLPSANSSLPQSPVVGLSLERMKNILPPLAAERGVPIGPAVEAGAALAARRLDDCLSWAPRAHDRAVKVATTVSNHGPSGSVGLLATNLYAGYPQLLMQMLEALDVPIFKAEHGSAPGQSPLHAPIMRISDPKLYNDTLSFTPAQREAIVEFHPKAGPFAVVGTPLCLRRTRLRRVQRKLAQLRDGASRTAIWCTGIYPNNITLLPHYWIDGPYHLLRKTVIEECLKESPTQFVIKLHPAIRYVDGDPLAGTMALPANCRAVADRDFRYLRACGDLILVDGPGSVLAWAMGVGVPVIYLEFGMYTLSEEAEKAFREGVFYVDVRTRSGRQKLAELLATPQHSLREAYRALAPGRARMLQRFVFGPEGVPGRKCAHYVKRRFKPALDHR